MFQKHDTGPALALIAIAVGATSQLTMGEGLFSLWSTMIGIILLLLIHAYERDVGVWSPERVALAAIKAYSWIFAIGFLIDIPFAFVPISTLDVNRCFAFYELWKGDTLCFVETRDVVIFVIWLFLFFLIWQRRRAQSESAVKPGDAS